MADIVRAIVIKGDAMLVMKRNQQGLQFYSLIGGHIDAGETPEHALYREFAEESGVRITDPQLVYIQLATTAFGEQNIYLCKYVDGEPSLAEASEEKISTIMGDNTYEPVWLSFSELAQANLLPVELKAAIIEGLAHGWPQSPIELKIAG